MGAEKIWMNSADGVVLRSFDADGNEIFTTDGKPIGLVGAEIKSNIPATASMQPLISNGNNSFQMSSDGVITVKGADAVVGLDGFPAGTKNVVILFSVTDSTNNNQQANQLMAAINEAILADYSTLFTNTVFKNRGAAFKTVSDAGVLFASKEHSVIEFHTTADITSLGCGFLWGNGATNGSRPTYAYVYYW